MNKVDEIKQFWDDQAKEHQESDLATNPDRLAKQLEIETISRFLEDGLRVADIGCGNGYSSLAYCRQYQIHLTGLDYSEEMVKQALQAQSKCSTDISERLSFREGNILATELPDNHFDRVITDRCVINLTNREDQAAAFSEMHRILKPGGLYLMCENSENSLANLNNVRTQVGLEPIAVRWHNLYLNETILHETMASQFELVEEVRFASFYYLASRVINALSAQSRGETPAYDSDINHAAARCSSQVDAGDYGPVKLLVWRKR